MPALLKPPPPLIRRPGLGLARPEEEPAPDFDWLDPEIERLTIRDIADEITKAYKIADMGRHDPPEDEWAGRSVSIDDVADSSGDERDWFSFPMRLEAHLLEVALFRKARKLRRKLSSGFDFGQIMWVGDMGASKSVSACEEAAFWHERGHEFFHNGGFNFGRVIEGADIYEIIARIPRHSVVAIDEAHTSLESGAAMTTGIRSFAILCAGLRKKGCKLLLMSAMARMVVRIVREMTSQVRRPFKIKADLDDHGFHVERPAHSDPRNFVLAWEKWDGFPFRGADIVEGRGRRRNDGLGRPHGLQTSFGELVRHAFLLTDSFRPVDTAHAQRYAGKAAMEAARAAAEVGLTDAHIELLQWLEEKVDSADCPPTFTAEAVGLALAMPPRRVGQLLKGLFGDVEGAQDSRGRWRAREMRAAINDKFAFAEA